MNHKPARETNARVHVRRQRTLWVAAGIMFCIGGCANGPARKMEAPRSHPAPSVSGALVVGQPCPKTIMAERSFVLPIAGAVLEARRREAAVSVPLIYSYQRPRGGVEAQKRRYAREFSRWLATVARLRVRNLKEFKKAHERHGRLLGVTIPQATFDRLRRATPRWRVNAAFAAMVRDGVTPYLIAKKGLPEQRAKAEVVVLRTEGRRGRWREEKLKRQQVKELAEARAALAPLGEKHGAKLSKVVRDELVSVVGALLAPTLVLDQARMRAAWVEARSKVKRTPKTFVRGQTIVAKGEVLTAELRATVDYMRSARCEPCTGGIGPCSGGLLLRLKLGGRIMRPIRATRSFAVPLDAERKQVIQAQARDAVPEVLVVDAQVGARREKALRRVLDQAERLEGDKRWDKLLAGLESSLGAKVLPQLVESFEKVPWKELRAALLALYSNTQREPISAGKAIASRQPCTLVARAKGAPRERDAARCPVLPLARIRLDLPLRAGKTLALLAKMSDETQKALIELVQYLLVANTTSDEAETKRRRDKAAAQAKGEERFYVKGDVVLPAGQPLTRVDQHTLKKMFELRCNGAGSS